jgi:lysophospholipase L1-like esterase
VIDAAALKSTRGCPSREGRTTPWRLPRACATGLPIAVARGRQWLAAIAVGTLFGCASPPGPEAAPDGAPPSDDDAGMGLLPDANGAGMPPPTPVDAGAPPAPDASVSVPPEHDAGSAPKPIWVAAWGDAPDSASGGAGSNQTFRQIVKPTVGSRGKARLHFSNFFGTAPVVLGAIHVGLQASGAAVSGDVPVTFGGASTVTIPAGAFVTSDDVAFSFTYGDVLAVTEYVSGNWTALTQHTQGAGVVTSYATASSGGDQTADLAGTHFTQHILETYLLDRIEVYGDYAETVATLGSSTTDGIASGLDAHETYPEQLAAALHAAGRDDVGVANVGIAGTTVLGPGATAGINRFARDVVALPNVTTVIDYLGANDLRINCVAAGALIAGKQSLLSQAHAAGIKIYVATTAPSTFCGNQNPSGFGTRFAQGSGEEAQRFLVLDWERGATKASGDGGPSAVADAIVDFNGAIVDPSNTSYMLPALDSGDDIHPNATGYGLMVKAIPLSLF